MPDPIPEPPKPFDVTQISLEEWVAAGQACCGVQPADDTDTRAAPAAEPPQ